MNYYKIILVPNGNLRELLCGVGINHTPFIPQSAHTWGIFDTLKDLKERFAELAYEEADRRVENMMSIREMTEEECRNERDSIIASFMDSLTIEWEQDLKFVKAVELDEDDNLIQVL